MLKSITKKDTRGWFKQLRIDEPGEDKYEVFFEGCKKFEYILLIYKEKGCVDRNLVEDFSKHILKVKISIFLTL